MGGLEKKAGPIKTEKHPFEGIWINEENPLKGVVITHSGNAIPVRFNVNKELRGIEAYQIIDANSTGIKSPSLIKSRISGEYLIATCEGEQTGIVSRDFTAPGERIVFSTEKSQRPSYISLKENGEKYTHPEWSEVEWIKEEREQLEKQKQPTIQQIDCQEGVDIDYVIEEPENQKEHPMFGRGTNKNSVKLIEKEDPSPFEGFWRAGKEQFYFITRGGEVLTMPSGISYGICPINRLIKTSETGGTAHHEFLLRSQRFQEVPPWGKFEIKQGGRELIVTSNKGQEWIHIEKVSD